MSTINGTEIPSLAPNYLFGLRTPVLKDFAATVSGSADDNLAVIMSGALKGFQQRARLSLLCWKIVIGYTMANRYGRLAHCMKSLLSRIDRGR